MSQAFTLRILAATLAVAAAAGTTRQEPGATPSRPAGSLEYWLSRAAPADSRPGVEAPEAHPLGPGRSGVGRRDALPGVVVLSDGKLLAGYVYTTRDKHWEVWVDSEKRWRHVPPILVLGIRAVVVEERMDKEWRWKEMGSDERVYTGRVRPVRRHQWTFHLIDGSRVTGTVKGQPLWVAHGGKTHGPFVLHERSAGRYGQTLDDLVYVHQVVISRRAMADALDKAAAGPKTRSSDAGDSQ